MADSNRRFDLVLGGVGLLLFLCGRVVVTGGDVPVSGALFVADGFFDFAGPCIFFGAIADMIVQFIQDRVRPKG